MDRLRSKLGQQLFLTLDKYQSGVSRNNFQKTGKLTAEEFVIAGDFLVENFPSWSWSGGLEDKKRAHLPPAKQFLITKNVPCFPVEERQVIETAVEGEDDGWVETTIEGLGNDDDVEELPSSKPATTTVADDHDDDDDDDDDDVGGLDGLCMMQYGLACPATCALGMPAQKYLLGRSKCNSFSLQCNLDFDYSGQNIVEEDSAAAPDESVRSLRTYDLTIHYDTHYSTPRVWLYGYHANGTPLKGDEWESDFSKDHVGKTVSREQHPHLSFACPSIHPCKHAEAMKTMFEQLAGQRALDVQYYLVIFLKFIQAIIPAIQYDYTSSLQIVGQPDDDDEQ
eukprot:TRINITY_DN12364_c1_g7_i4.p1 TRINITY_DN12364_c1_g7~~TRINITY_DN12364_c1_g7_i4.p1  ORF type:complete len:338 (+),score=89.26 TRINITY_DN12364_c1_g7_i4:86-1099(+)